MEFKHLMAYAAVVRRNSFSKAAEELFLSQPTVSMYIRQLEEELNTVLLVRTTKSLEITPKGQEVYEYAVSILSLKDKLIRNCGPNAGDLITIGASTVPSAYLLPEVLAAYRQKNSRIQFTVDQGDSRLILDRLKDGLYDLGIIGMDPQDDSLLAIPFFLDTIVITTPCAERFQRLRELISSDPSRENAVLAALLKGLVERLGQSGVVLAHDKAVLLARGNLHGDGEAGVGALHLVLHDGKIGNRGLVKTGLHARERLNGVVQGDHRGARKVLLDPGLPRRARLDRNLG